MVQYASLMDGLGNTLMGRARMFTTSIGHGVRFRERPRPSEQMNRAMNVELPVA